MIKNNQDWVIELRRYFHAHPEQSGQEYNTQQKIIAELKRIGLQPCVAAGTGVIADINGDKPGKTVALRADIDALELIDRCGKPYQSLNEGVCHACGHDGHTAILLGAARILSELKDSLSGKIRLIFQPSEEVFPGGAVKMIEEGVLKGVDIIFALHLWQPLQVGTIGVSYGAVMASPDEFTINISGRGGHGGMPHQAIDALLTGAQVVNALNTVVSRNINPLEHAVLSIGVFKSGDMPNVVADLAVIKGTVRTFDEGVRKTIFTRIEQITQGICQAAGAKYSIAKTFGFPPVINDPALARVVAGAACETVGNENVLEVKPSMVAEDFSLYQQKVPGVYIYVGAGNAEKGIIYPQHHPQYDMDEKALAHGVEVFVRMASIFA
ncbi:N-acetyldiaminopimelate deacetylase [bioreactor metagenome]|uniref:N-acetyldiaminopimelate deacetylase n=1 Tax=bioreactor metagenome TaxID=1076179 RepID=A0A644URB3_9ZZZZ|nr:amidohydrolase [Negativicutes bacterium]